MTTSNPQVLFFGVAFLLVGIAFLYTGVRGLLGFDIALPTKSGSVQHFTGQLARVAGGVSAALGLLFLYFCYSTFR
jgi:hypothetical protein